MVHWFTPKASNANMTWSFTNPITSTNISVWLFEDQSVGQLVNQWSLDCHVGDGWVPCHSADVSIGHKRIVNVLLPQDAAVGAKSELTAIRLNIDSHFALPDQLPSVAKVELYDWASQVGCV
jgi:hypothetical protein